MAELPKMFRSDREGKLLTDQPVSLRWCDCGCGGPVSVDARPNACSVADAGPPSNGGRRVRVVDWETGEVVMVKEQDGTGGLADVCSF